MTSCYREYECDTSSFPKKTYLLPEEAKNVFAYKGEDTIRFLKNNTDTIVYIGEKIDTFFRESISRSECEGNINFYEGYQTNLNAINNPLINLSLYYSESNSDYIGIAVTYDNNVRFSFNYLKAQEPPDIDSMIINGNIYYDIFYIKVFYDEPILLYNKEFGILKLTTNTVKLEVL